MGGTSKQSTNTNSQTRTDPYAPTQPGLQDIIGQIGGQIPNSGPTATESNALDALGRNAAAGNPYAPKIAGLADDLLGGGPDRTGMVNSAYSDFKGALSPYATSDTNPYSNPSFVNATNTMSNDIMDRIKSQYAGAGYTPTSSGDFGQQVARGVSQGVAPTWLQANNDLENRKLGAISGLLGGAGTTAGLLSGLDQTAFGNRQAGVGVAGTALQAADSPYLRQLQIEAQRRGLPLSGLGSLESLLLPLAQVGGVSNSTGQSTGEYQMSGADQFAKIAGGLKSLTSLGNPFAMGGG
jgi:hypothetical protein